MPPLDRGTYVLEWHTLSMVDGHSTPGVLVFGVGMPPRPSTRARGPADLTLLTWFDLGATLLAPVRSVSVAPCSPGGRPGRRMRTRLFGPPGCARDRLCGRLTPLLKTWQWGMPLGIWLDQTLSTLAATSWGWLWSLREVARRGRRRRLAVGLLGADRPARRAALVALSSRWCCARSPALGHPAGVTVPAALLGAAT